MFSVGLFYGFSRVLMIGSAKYFRCLIELCLETPSQKGSHAKAQSSDSITSFAPLRLCVRFVVHSFSVVTGKGLTQRREGAGF